MSSSEDEYDDAIGASMIQGPMKKRRIQRACDICRRKKIRCDGGQMPGNRCSNCIASEVACTYVETAKKRGPPKGYIENIEIRLERMERFLRKLSPDGNLPAELSGNLELNASDKVESRIPSSSRSFNQPVSEMSSLVHSQYASSKRPPDIASPLIQEDDSALDAKKYKQENIIPDLLADRIEKISLETHNRRFFGKSSGAMLIQTAMELREQYTGKEADPGPLGHHRPEFWNIRPWELSNHNPPHPAYEFPEEGLICDLTNLYFKKYNLFIPLLHRPTFERSIEEGLHHKSDSFGANVLLVCAIGSRYSKDPRVLLEGADSPHSSGWKWFQQVQIVQRSLLAPVSLHDLQFYCLSVQFLQGSSAPQSCWTMVGIGIRLAQDVGAHRGKRGKSSPSIEDELWKRAFWTLVSMDRQLSAGLGRPCAIQDEDFDLDMAIECDDEYWDHPDAEQRFKQPPGKPSLITAFNLYLELNQVLALSLRTLYSTKNAKILHGVVSQPEWEPEHVVTELDSALNKWFDSIPEHLRWDPGRKDDTFFHQAAMLYSSYYHIQIIIHRPFIPSPSKPSPLSFPSLAICTNAARSCSHVIDSQRLRDDVHPPHIHIHGFTSGIVLLLNIWGGKRTGLLKGPNRDIVDLHKCLHALKSLEKWCHSAGRLWDILFGLASVGDLPLPHVSSSTSNRRERDAQDMVSTPAASGSVSNPVLQAPRNTASSPRVQTDAATTESAIISFSQPQMLGHASLGYELFLQQDPIFQQYVNSPKPSSEQRMLALPAYNDERGRLALREQSQVSPTTHTTLGDNYGYWHPPLISSDGSGSATSSHAHTPHPFEMNNMFPTELQFSTSLSHVTHDSTLASYGSGSYSTPMEGLSSNTLLGDRDASSLDTAQHQQQGFVDSDTLTMWSNAPTGFQLDEWGAYLSSVSEHPKRH